MSMNLDLTESDISALVDLLNRFLCQTKQLQHCRRVLNAKMDAMTLHRLYSLYTEETDPNMRAYFRHEYLDRAGVSEDFCSREENP